MAGRPVKKRTEKTFSRDIEVLARLRESIQLNETGETSLEAIDLTNRLIHTLLIMKSDTKEAA